MRRFTLFFLALFACLMAGAQSYLPDFSTEDSPVYLPVKFKTGGAYLGDQGSGKNMQTVASTSDATQFQFIGTQSSFIMKSKLGNYVTTTGSGDDLRYTTTSTKSEAATLTIINGSASKYYEIRRSDASYCMNQWQGTGAGKALGAWTAGDNNNQLYFEGATGSVKELTDDYNALVKKINAAANYQFFYRDASAAVAAIPSTTPTTTDGLTEAIATLTEAYNAIGNGELQGTEIAGKHVILANLLHTTFFAYANGTKMGSGTSYYTTNNIWEFVATGTDGEYYLKNVGTGLYVGTVPTKNNTPFSLVESVEDAGVYTVEASSTNGHCIIYSKTGTANLETLHMVNWDGVVRWNKTAEASQFLLIDATDAETVINSAYYTIKNGSGGYVSADADYLSSGNLLLSNSKSPTSRNGLWHLLKTSSNNYQFVNAGKGTIISMTGSEDAARATLVSPAADDSEATTEFNGTFNINSTSASYIKLPSSANNYWNKRGNFLALWNDSRATNNDQGSMFYITEVDPNSDDFFSEFNTVEAGTRPTDISDFSLWYNVPVAHTTASDTWMEYALPLGNGQIGATIRGGLFKDEIQFNEKTLFDGSTANSTQGYYQNFGSIIVTDKSGSFSLRDDSKPVKAYNRYLDLMDGVGGVNYKSSDEATTYARRYFTSTLDKVLVAHYEANGTDKLALNFAYEPDTQIKASDVTYTDNGASFYGKLTIVKYNTAFKVYASEGATITKTDAGILVENAEWANLIMAAATDFDASKSGCVSGETAADLATEVTERIDAAAAKAYSTLLANHINGWSSLMSRVSLQLGTVSDKTTEDLIKYYATDANKTTDEGLYLESLYFQYGRYLTIGANYDTNIHAPSNLQGIWNDRSNTSFWHCDIHNDINVEMNYWPADPTNLSEMHQPFLSYIIDIASLENSPWKTLAQNIKSGAQGWTVACEGNIFGGSSTWENKNMKSLGAWYCTHLWRYYKYTLDRYFLKKALPVMYDAALFVKSIATKDSTGLYVITGEWSPEHGSYNQVTAFTQQNTYELLDEVFKAHEILGDESPLTTAQIANIQDLYNNYDKGVWTETYNGKTCISEWKNTKLSDQTHRHLSHLMCLFPYSQVSAFDTTEDGITKFQAAYNGQVARNGDVTGWSMGWQTNTYARCLDGDNSRRNLSLALRHSGSYVIEMSNYGGCYYNLFDSHSPFQIDGNYGCTSGVAECLLQSYDDIITILPALPSAWKKGVVEGLKAQGNFNVDEAWEEGKPTLVRITNNLDQDRQVSVRLNKEVVTYDIEANGTLTLDCTSGSLPTGITSAKAEVPASVNVIYDLSGRRVNKAEKGVYIVNGQKVIR